MQQARLLLLDDDKEFIDVLHERLKLAGYSVTTCYNAADAIKEVQHSNFDVAIIDLILGDSDGITTMHRMKLIQPLLECIVLSGQGTLKLAVEAMKQGAFEYLEKPSDFEVVTHVINEALARKQAQEHRILNAGKRVYSKLEKAMIGATFAQAGQFETAKNVMEED
jgi:DNA-binding NtrC family response regulator